MRRTRVKKMKFDDFDQNVKNGLHLARQNACDIEFQKSEYNPKAFLQWLVEKVKNETDATF